MIRNDYFRNKSNRNKILRLGMIGKSRILKQPLIMLNLQLYILLRAYWGFADHFKDQAENLLQSLDYSYKKILQVSF